MAKQASMFKRITGKVFFHCLLSQRAIVQCNTVNYLLLKANVHPKQLISESKFSGSRKFTFRYQLFEITPAEM